MDSDVIRGNVDTIILRCLAQGEMYGIEIANFVLRATEGNYTLKKPTMYSALERLRKRKLVSVRMEHSPIGGNRTYYNLTDQGREFLANKKFDWQYSKILIDNLVLDKKKVVEAESADVMPIAFEKAGKEVLIAATGGNEVNESETAASAAAERSTVVVTARPVTPMEEYVAAGKYITVPLTLKPNTAVASATGLSPYNTATTAEQVAINIPIIEKVNVTQPPVSVPTVAIQPFVKHTGVRRNGKFVLYNKLRLACSAIVCVALAMGLICVGAFVKGGSFTPQENTFIALGWVALGLYLLANIALYTAYPKHKRVIKSRRRDMAGRSAITAAIAMACVSINIIAGLSAIRADDFLVSLIVPCIVGSLFVLEGLAILALKRVPFFLT